MVTVSTMNEERLKKKTVSGNLSALQPLYLLQYFFILGS
ncbi:hypothetical protein SAMN04487787_106134 [Kosakonia sacchari]|nr:hypothetical protein SAMN04487787_106134 [Kosakonia sacchari]